MLGIGAGGVKCTEVRTSWLSSGHALPCSREVCGQIGFLRGYGVDMDWALSRLRKKGPHHLGLPDGLGSFCRSILTISRLSVWIPCALEFRNRSRRPAWICKQMHPQLMTLFYNCALKNASRKVLLKYNTLIDKLSPTHHLAFCIIVRPCFFFGNMIQ